MEVEEEGGHGGYGAKTKKKWKENRSWEEVG